MSWQLVLTWIAISAAGVYVLWRVWRALRAGKSGCGGGCGCAKSTNAPALIEPAQLTLRQR